MSINAEPVRKKTLLIIVLLASILLAVTLYGHYFFKQALASELVLVKQYGAGADRAYSSVQSENALLDKRLLSHYQRLHGQYLRKVIVSSVSELLVALNNAQAGDDIVMLAGHYQLSQTQIYLLAQGSDAYPIRLRAEIFGSVSVDMQTKEGFVIQGDYWIIENLQLNGHCDVQHICDHAIHFNGASHIIIRNNQLTNFNSAIKANGFGDIKGRRYPDDVLIESNSIFNDSVRLTNKAVTLIDVVAGNDWLIRRNFIANHSKYLGNRISYAAFVKGNSYRSLFEYNVVDCEWRLKDDQSIRLGLSLGGGGTGPAYCREQDCQYEHHDGVIRDNLIINCRQDVGIYVNKAKNSLVERNILLNNTGIDIRFSQSSANLTENLLSGQIRNRQQAHVQQQNNHQGLTLGELKKQLLKYKRQGVVFCRNDKQGKVLMDMAVVNRICIKALTFSIDG